MSKLWLPHDYQKRAVELLISRDSAGLFLDPGLGKTSVTLQAFKILRDAGMADNGMLVIAPLRVCHNVWPAEIQKWANFGDISIQVLHGPHKERRLQQRADVYVINPEGLNWLFDDRRKEFRPDWDILCVDESTKFKDSQTKRFKLMRPHFPKFARRWILTGTPVPNGLHDLFGQIYILDLGDSLGRYITHYRNRYFTTEAWNQYSYIPLRGAFEEVVEKISPMILRLAAEDYLDMPDLPPIDPIMVDLPPKARKHYDDIETEFITLLEDGVIVASNAAVAGGKCRQIANGAIYTQEREWEEFHSEKITALTSLLEELSGNPLLVMYEFQHDRDRLLATFGAKTPVIGGGTSTRQADKYIRDFNKGHIPLLLCHPASMAHGLNLQDSCNHIVWFGIPWNLEHYDQSIARIYRQGQEKPVFVYHIVARNTLDEKVLKVLAAKDRTQKTLLASLTN